MTDNERKAEAFDRIREAVYSERSVSNTGEAVREIVWKYDDETEQQEKGRSA